ncbi:hypothetical protein [Pedobacter sp. Leaf132]|uniref:hypothetical protein n=1 Tax=Pedobacter sp. Leaf132 TaxID=2876557 RepID=UPI001E4378B7|nr:hypothetical protein [Pedobacter sp. Leaf132]
MEKISQSQLEDELNRIAQMEVIEQRLSDGKDTELGKYLFERKIKVSKMLIETLMSDDEKMKFLNREHT